MNEAAATAAAPAAAPARVAACCCGQLRLAVRGEPMRVSACHCRACQRRTGSAFGLQARFAADAVTIEGDASEYIRTADSGHRIHLHFCPACGSTVYYRFENHAQFIGIAVGAFADPGFPPPQFSVWEKRRHPWVAMPDGVAHQD